MQQHRSNLDGELRNHQLDAPMEAAQPVLSAKDKSPTDVISETVEDNIRDALRDCSLARL